MLHIVFGRLNPINRDMLHTSLNLKREMGFGFGLTACNLGQPRAIGQQSRARMNQLWPWGNIVITPEPITS